MSFQSAKISDPEVGELDEFLMGSCGFVWTVLYFNGISNNLSSKIHLIQNLGTIHKVCNEKT